MASQLCYNVWRGRSICLHFENIISPISASYGYESIAAFRPNFANYFFLLNRFGGRAGEK